MQNASHPAIRKSFWKIEDVVQSQEFGAYSLVILSYMIGELANESLELLLQKAWDSASEVLVVIEPGTMHGFERIRKAREWLIKQGGFLVAPCPHHGACPIPKGDWCHFSVRLERSSLHMVLKDASLGYEDEKFSYVVASKKPVELPQARILRHPQHHSGHIDLTLCAQEGLIKKTVSKRHGEAYKKARKAEWGDIWNE
jgi:ribosomal protein RSM22 (predicted rRNA methylase)